MANSLPNTHTHTHTRNTTFPLLLNSLCIGEVGSQAPSGMCFWEIWGRMPLQPPPHLLTLHLEGRRDAPVRSIPGKSSPEPQQ